MEFLMYEVYKVFLQQKLPRVLSLMNEMLQFSLEKRIGDYFLMEQGTVIRIYGFVHPPYVLPSFLTLRIFSLEFIRKNIIVENENFINFKKSYEIKFPWVVGPFIIKSKVSFPIMDNLLKEMRFQRFPTINYDPHHVISIRRQVNKNKPFEHYEVEGMSESANWTYYTQVVKNEEDTQYGFTSCHHHI